MTASRSWATQDALWYFHVAQRALLAMPAPVPQQGWAVSRSSPICLVRGRWPQRTDNASVLFGEGELTVFALHQHSTASVC